MQTAMTYFEASDVARALGVSASAIRSRALSQRLRPRARTVRGVGLYDPADVERVRVERQQRRRARRAAR